MVTKSPSLKAQEDCDQDYSKLVLLALYAFNQTCKVISELCKLCRASHCIHCLYSFRNVFTRAHTKLQGNLSSTERCVTDKNEECIWISKEQLSRLSLHTSPNCALTALAFPNSWRWALKFIGPISTIAAVILSALLLCCWERRRDGLGMRWRPGVQHGWAELKCERTKRPFAHSVSVRDLKSGYQP